MLEVFAYKKYKKHKAAKEALSKQDEAFIRRSIEEQQKPSLFNFGRKRQSVDIPPTPAEEESVKTDAPTTPTAQEQDLANVLESLNLAVEKKTAFSLSDETRALLREFTQILKDIQAGGPHAYSDLTNFLQNKNEKLNSLFDTIPGFMKSLISTLPFPLARKLDKKSTKDVSVDILKDLAKPGVISGLLKNIMTVLRTRFPAFVGSNVLLSLGVFVLLFGLWYCYKRGKEERLKAEQPVVPEILVEGAKPDEIADHGDRVEPSGTQSPPLVQPTPIHPVAVPSVEPETLGSPEKKNRKSWFK